MRTYHRLEACATLLEVLSASKSVPRVMDFSQTFNYHYSGWQPFEFPRQ
ncbi:MAG: hypothetical protein F6K56_42710, partial [Moorea sp. SIO3G5]|nr:hypothetical protein [Moorena sp. SIO3G5]